MRADVILGFDPAPADLSALVGVSAGLRSAAHALIETRTGLDRLGRTGSVWDGAAGAPLAALLRRFSARTSALEESLVDCLHAVDVWREGVKAQVAEIVSAVAELGGDPAGSGRRTRLIALARELGIDHERAAADLAAAFEELSTSIEQVVDPHDDLPAELDRALLGLSAAVEDWMAAEAPELLRTALTLGEVAGLTTVISELIGIAALGRNPGEAEGVSELVARSPGSHRLIKALRQQWRDVAPAALPEATFARRRSPGLAQALAGRRTAEVTSAVAAALGDGSASSLDSGVSRDEPG